jgi:hypothetical protein
MRCDGEEGDNDGGGFARVWIAEATVLTMVKCGNKNAYNAAG